MFFKLMIIKGILAIGFFIFIFGWKIAQMIDLISLFSVAFFSAYVLILQGHISKSEAKIVWLLLLLVVYSTFITIIHGGIELHYPMRSLRALINFLGAIGIVGFFQLIYGKHYADQLLLHLFLSLVVHAIVIFAMYVSDTFRATVYDLTGAIAYGFVNLNTPILTGLRVSGLTYGLAQTSVLQMAGFFIFPFLYRRFMVKIFSVIFAFFLIISIFVSGRTGLILGSFLVPLAFLLYSIKYEIKELFFLFSTIVFVVILVLILKDSFLLPHKFYNYNMEWISEILEIEKSEDFLGLLQTMRDMYFLPHDAWIFLFGSGITGRGEGGYIPSDSGYVLSVFGVGIVGLSLMMSIYMVAFIYGIQVFNIHRGVSVFLMLLVISVFILNFKEFALLTRNQFSVLALLMCTASRLRFSNLHREFEGGDRR